MNDRAIEFFRSLERGQTTDSGTTIRDELTRRGRCHDGSETDRSLLETDIYEQRERERVSLRRLRKIQPTGGTTVGRYSKSDVGETYYNFKSDSDSSQTLLLPVFSLPVTPCV